MTHSLSTRFLLAAPFFGLAAFVTTSARAASTWTDLGAGFAATRPGVSRSIENAGQDIFVTVYATQSATNEVVATEFHNNVQVTGFDDLFGSTPYSPTAIAWPGHREVFVVGFDHQLYHAVSGSSGAFGSFQSLGGPQLCTHPSAVSWAANRVDVFGRSCATSNLIQFFWDGSRWSWSDRGFRLSGAPSACTSSPGTLDVWLRAGSGTLQDYRYSGNKWTLYDSGASTAFVGCAKTNPFETLRQSTAIGVSSLSIFEGVDDIFGIGGNPSPAIMMTGTPSGDSSRDSQFFYGRMPSVGMQRWGAGYVPNSRSQDLSVHIVSNPTDSFASDPVTICPDPRLAATKVFVVRSDGHLMLLDDTDIPRT